MVKLMGTRREMSNEEWVAAQAEWHNPDNWHYGFYYAPRDPHVWVRKQRTEFGWTLNMAHRSSWLWIAGLLALVLGLGPLVRVIYSAVQ